jgi:hypothetical protein
MLIVKTLIQDKIIFISTDCGNVTVVDGHFTAPSGTTFGETAKQSCNTGYNISGEEIVTCTETGEWNATVVTCTIVGMYTLADTFIGYVQLSILCKRFKFLISPRIETDSKIKTSLQSPKSSFFISCFPVFYCNISDDYILINH